MRRTVTVHGPRAVPHGGESDLLEYRPPSRYCPSDKLLAIAANEFGAIGDDAKLVSAVTTWVHDRPVYTSGSSGSTDDAVDTLLLGAGVPRLRAPRAVAAAGPRRPARLAAVYAPGLDPVDFHAVVEAWVDGAWRLVDATGLAPRASMLRIATGRDAAGHRVHDDPPRRRHADGDDGDRDGGRPAVRRPGDGDGAALSTNGGAG